MDKQQILVYLDKLIDEVAVERVISMAKERRRVVISFNDDGTPVYKSLQANSQEEMNDKIVKTYIECGRIKEFLPESQAPLQLPQNSPNEVPLLKDYALEWLQRKRKLKSTTKANYKKYLEDYILPVLGEKKGGPDHSFKCSGDARQL